MKKWIAFLVAITTILVIALQPATLPQAEGITSLASEAQLRHIALALAQRNQSGFFPFMRDNRTEGLAPSLEARGNSVTQTNTQIQGIDEADLIKSDGTHVYTLFDNVLRMYAIDGNALRLVKTLAFDAEEFYASSMFIVDGNLVVLASSGGWWFMPYNRTEPVDEVPPTRGEEVKPEPGVTEPGSPGISEPGSDNDPGTISDLPADGTSGSDPSEPVKPDDPATTDPSEPVKPDDPATSIAIRPIFPPGEEKPFTQHVIVLDKTTLATQHTLEIEGNLIGSRLNGTQLVFVTSKYNWVENNAIDSLQAKDVLPVISLDGSEFDFTIQDIHYIDQPNTLNVLTITTFDLSNNATQFKHAFLDAHTLYMNHETILLASSTWEMNTERSPWGSTKTHIYALSYVNDITLKAKATLNGSLLNQFAMDEYRGAVRVALTQWGETTTNSIVTLNANLDILDSITGIAPTESIYSVCFVQDRAYVVTFEQIDPFFVIDVSDPNNIAILGELKIPGYSTYLHPLSPTLILGFGRDVIVHPDGRIMNGAMKLSLFDVTQEQLPVEKQVLLIGNENTWGEVSYDHKALMVNPQRQLLGFFVTSHVMSTREGQEFYKSVATYYLISTANDAISIVDEIEVNNVWQLKAIMVNDALHLLLPDGDVITRVYP